jgi:hypothetical protein
MNTYVLSSRKAEHHLPLEHTQHLEHTHLTMI